VLSRGKHYFEWTGYCLLVILWTMPEEGGGWVDYKQLKVVGKCSSVSFAFVWTLFIGAGGAYVYICSCIYMHIFICICIYINACVYTEMYCVYTYTHINI